MPHERDLVGQWRHSFEEDHDGIQVFRPADHPLPRARGRDGFDIEPDGTFIDRAVGPDDRNPARRGSWTLSDGRLTVTPPTGPPRSMEIAAAGGGRLELRPADPS